MFDECIARRMVILYAFHRVYLHALNCQWWKQERRCHELPKHLPRCSNPSNLNGYFNTARGKLSLLIYGLYVVDYLLKLNYFVIYDFHNSNGRTITRLNRRRIEICLTWLINCGYLQESVWYIYLENINVWKCIECRVWVKNILLTEGNLTTNQKWKLYIDLDSKIRIPAWIKIRFA